MLLQTENCEEKVMAYTMHEVVVGALLHDVGKFLQRAYDRLSDVTGQHLDLESTLCPQQKSVYTHKHVLFTNAFFDLMSKEEVYFPAGINAKTVEDISSYHHKPDACPIPGASWLCALGDRLSAGMDRRDDEETSERASSRNTFKKTPLRCVFDEVILDPKALGMPQAHAYRLGVLNPEDAESMIPIAWPSKGEVPELPKRYQEVWQQFWGEIKVLGREAPRLSFDLFEEALLGLLERYTWAIPSSTVNSPDISLYDHARTTAAIAACLYRYHDAKGQLEDVKSIKDEQQMKFRLLAGDLSGIQNTLFSLQTQGVKGVNKILRARSFMMSGVSEAAALLSIELLSLPICTVLQQAGGRFLILVPALGDTEDHVDGLRERFDKWLVEHYTGSLALNLVLSPPFSASSFKPHPLREIMAGLGQAIEDGKQRPLSKCSQGVLKREYPLDALCSACGVRPAVTTGAAESGYRCLTCHDEFRIGRDLVGATVMVWGRSLPREWNPVDVIGLELALLRNHPENLPGEALSVRRTSPLHMPIPWAVRNLANHIPVFKDHYETQDPRYEGSWDDDVVPRIGEPKSFAHIAADALEPEKDSGAFRGKAFLALLKADVDYLGFLFNFGLKRTEAEEDRFTLSRIAQLSRMVDLYFTGYLKGLLHREFPDTYTIYAGGDDLLFIGPWRQTLALTSRVNETFRAYTGHNPNITLSAGVSLLKPNYPVNRAVLEAQEYLDESKYHGRNRVCALLEKPVSWECYIARLKDAEWVHQRMHDDSPVSTSFIYRLLVIAMDAEAVAIEANVQKAGWRARLAYHLARNIKARTNQEKEKMIVEWLEHLGLDDQLKLTTKHTNIIDWRLPLTVALYRNRT